MSVRPHPTKGDNFWIIDYYPHGRKGKRIRTTYKGTRAEALEYELHHRRNRVDVVNEISPLVKDLAPAWLDNHKNEVAEKTYKRTVGAMANWIPFFGNFKPANITQKTISLYKNNRLLDVANKAAVDRGRPPRYISKRTVNKELSGLSTLLKWAAENGHCNDLPFQIKGFSARQTKDKAPKPLTPRQVTKMHELIEPQYKLIFLLMADMGLRVTEATHAEAEWVDEYRETIAVMGKGSKERILPWTTERVAKALVSALDKIVSGYLSTNPKKGNPYVDMRKPIQRAAEKAGITRKINPHLLRHTCLTNLAEQGMSPHALQQFAGHESIDTTNKIYTHIRSDYVGSEVRKIRKRGGLER